MRFVSLGEVLAEKLGGMPLSHAIDEIGLAFTALRGVVTVNGDAEIRRGETALGHTDRWRTVKPAHNCNKIHHSFLVVFAVTLTRGRGLKSLMDGRRRAVWAAAPYTRARIETLK